ncbi:hypothetical protein BJ978_000503 [Agromyces terreus]|uniref:Putative amidase domain-containing protein n=1 Tax=Agromyces terreus TaxID=424795 RepID=A0A9X2H2U3_9MICO|nr:amidase domain-containing protein [Agromyces terreus]MCP2369827.1 hypothetical protein [Agromyces terreus]
MTTPTRAMRRRRAVVLVAAATVVILTCGFIALGWSAALPSDRSTTGADSLEVDASSAPSDEADESDGAEEVALLDWSTLTPEVSAQMEYVREHWDDTESEEFGYIFDNDCMAFASQSLLARGWLEDDEWWYAVGDGYTSSVAWRSSTGFMEYLEERPEKATALTDDQRDQVAIGDIVQFDWDLSGDRDHTGIVTGVVQRADGSIDVEYAGHTDHTWDRSVDWSITVQHPGAVATYWHLSD